MTTRHADLVEYGSALELELEPADVSELRAVARRWRTALRLRHEPLLAVHLEGSRYAVSARGVAGFVRIGDLNFQIAPKFLNADLAGPGWKRALWRLIAYGHGVDLLNAKAAGTTVASDGIADVLADLFIASVSHAAVKGYPLGYVPDRERSDFLRGRLDQQRVSELLPFTGKLPVITSRLTKDVPTNRLLKWAALELAKLVETPHRRKTLRMWAATLDGVAPHPPRADRVESPNRQYAHLIAGVEIGKLLLNDRSASFGPGTLDLPGFLWDSEDLFERTTLRLFDEAARPLGMAATKRSRPLIQYSIDGSPHQGHTTPDVDVHERGTTRFLADAKYKVLGAEPDNDDVYQVMAGGRVATVSTTALVYPDSGSRLSVREFFPFGYGEPARIDALLLGLEAFASERGVRVLRQDVTSWLEENLVP